MKIFIIILLIIILIYYKLNSQDQNIETFYTFFKPYYSNKKIYNYDLYDKKIYNSPGYDNNFNYKPLTIASTSNKTKNMFLELITKIILNNSNILYINYIKYDNYKKMLHDLNNNNVQLISASYSLYDQLKNLNNIRHVCTTDIKYIYICKRTDNAQLKNFSYIYNNTKIGVLNKEESYIFTKNLMKFIGLTENKDYKIIVYKDESKLLDDLNNNKVSIAIFNDVYPTNIFNKYYNLKLMELNGFRTNIFFEQYNEYYSEKLINLNNFGSNYLPKNYDNNEYTIFKPYFNVITYETVLLTNTKVPNNYITEILQSISDNIPLLNTLEQYKKANIKYNTSVMNKNVHGIFPSDATIQYLNNKGYTSDIDNNNCKYFIGNKECNKKNLLRLT